MSKDNDKIIDFFKKTPKDGNNMQQKFFKGFQYVKILRDDNGNSFKEELLREYAKKCFYIVTVMKNNGIGTALYKYKVPYDLLLNFLNVFKDNNNYGEIIDIERYIPEDLA
ncbi:MAG: hypothetical protein LUH11_02755 [Candidatus Gastranaerophilales bacterium]|nr:hypothetical protein [Candidatus Gastranaerophilales bacterium]